MFQVYADDNLIFDSRLDGEYVLEKGILDLEVNKSGSFTFTIYKDHPYYDQIQKLSTIITVYRDEVLIYRGRVIRSSDGFYNDKTFICEGELSFLLDSVQRAYTFAGSPAALFRQFINGHNAQVGADKRFTVGRITVTDPNDYINRSNSAYESTLNNLSEKLVNSLGGYIDITPGSGDSRVINWISDYPDQSAQSITFGENLLDFTKSNSAETIITALLPLGAIIETEGTSESEQRVTIESVTPDGSDFIYDQAAVDMYGWIFGVQIWDDVTEPSNLLRKAQAALAERINIAVSIELSAIDLSAMDKDIDAFKLGDHVRVVSLPHNLDASYLLTKQSIDLLHPENNKITLGYTYTTFTDTTYSSINAGASVTQKVEAIGSSYVSNAKLQDEIAASTAYITDDVLTDYTTSEQVNTALTALHTQIGAEIRTILAGEWVYLNLEAWFNPYGSSDRGPQIKTVGDMVHIRGAVTPIYDITFTSDPVTLANGIPSGARPLYDTDFTVYTDSTKVLRGTVTTAGRITISPLGDVTTILSGSKLSIAFSYDV